MHTNHKWRARMVLSGLAALALLVTAPPLHAQSEDVDTPTEGATPAPPTQPTSPDITGETPAQPREVLVPVQPEGPQKKRKRKFHIGPDLELFIPSDSKTQDRYGNSWFGIGFGFGSVRPEGLLGTWSGEGFLIHNKKTEVVGTTEVKHEAYIIPLGIVYRRALVDRTDARPYVGASANLVLADFNSPKDGVRWGLRTAAGGSVLAGLTFKRTGYVEARYLLVTEMRGLDFSGLNLTGGIRF